MCCIAVQTSAWGDFQEAFAAAAKKTNGGQGLYFLSETITSPTLAAQWKQVQAAYPQAKLVQWEPVNQDSSRAASKAAFGSYTDAQYKLEDADVILSLDADFLGGIAHPGFLPMAAAYAERHRYEEGKTMNRLYVVETMPTVTGFKADHRLALKPSEIAAFATALANGAAPHGFESRTAQKFFTAVIARSEEERRPVCGDSGRAGFAGGACGGLCAELLRWARSARRSSIPRR